jgi:hypothetical protein
MISRDLPRALVHALQVLNPISVWRESPDRGTPTDEPSDHVFGRYRGMRHRPRGQDVPGVSRSHGRLKHQPAQHLGASASGRVVSCGSAVPTDLIGRNVGHLSLADTEPAYGWSMVRARRLYEESSRKSPLCKLHPAESEHRTLVGSSMRSWPETLVLYRMRVHAEE